MAVDMDGYWQAGQAVGLGVPFVALRCIVDAASQSLPAWTTRVARRGGRSGLAALLTLAVGPWQAAPLLTLALASRRAQRRLAEAAAAVAERGLAPA